MYPAVGWLWARDGESTGVSTSLTRPIGEGSHDRTITSLFLYDFTPGSPVYEEPEGLTIWDLEEQRASYLDPDLAPYIQGQLHVLLLQN